ncbi:hypothetical protein [Frondihabitans cladoniiphilus]|uniref:hypothetical protein n=1 Tax=Frondihabitans cladoniiphilus TaxID=715785 RepID=UPI0031E9E6BD
MTQFAPNSAQSCGVFHALRAKAGSVLRIRETGLIPSRQTFPASIESLPVVVFVLEAASFVDNQLHSKFPEGRDALECSGSAERGSECVTVFPA